MHNPTTALAWELWRRNRRHMIFVAATLLFFIFVYPVLCAVAGFNPASSDASDEFARFLATNLGPPSPLMILHIISYMALAGGPAMAMVLTLLYAIWIFTFTTLDPKTKDPLAFTAHLFNLPVSTSFLFTRIMVGGLAAVLGLYALWIYCVRLPHFPSFPGYTAFQNGFGWLTLLVLGQAIVWSLAAWPFMRVLTMIIVGSLILYCWQGSNFFAFRLVLPPLFVLGVVMARAGLQKLRHGQWQGWNWQELFAKWTSRAELRGPRQFSSPAQAQLWFEWRRSAGPLCGFAVLLVLVPAAGLLIYVAAGYGPLSSSFIYAFSSYLVYMPLFLFFIFGISLAFQLSQGGRDQFFVLVRPLTSGELVLSMLKAVAITTLLTWAAVLMALGVMPWLGNFHEVEIALSPVAGVRVVLVIGLIFLTWRLSVINLCFGSAGIRWLSHMPVAILIILGMGVFTLDPDGARREWLFTHVGEVAAGLLVVKFLLAGAAFSGCLRRRLLTPSGVMGYLTVWGLLVAGLLAVLILVAPSLEKGALLPVSLVIVLFVPLARIGFAPLALACSRHVK